MTALDRMKERLEVGQPIVAKLSELKGQELKDKVIDILGNEDKYIEIIKDAHVTKTIENDIPTKISFSNYDQIEITFYGIWFHPEHGSQVCVKEFDKYFKYE